MNYINGLTKERMTIMGIITDIRNKIVEYRDNDSFDKIDMCNWLQKYIDDYAASICKTVKNYQNNNKDKHLACSNKWKKDHPEEYREQQREYKRNMRGYYEKHSKEILSKADDSLKDNRDAEVIEVDEKEKE